MRESEKWKWSRWVGSDSQLPHGLQPTRVLRPWDFPGTSTGVGCHCLLQSKHLGYVTRKAVSSIPSLIHGQTWLHPRCLTCSTLVSVALLLKARSEVRVEVRLLKGKPVSHYPKRRKKWCSDHKGVAIYHKTIHMSEGRGLGLIISKVFPCSKMHSFMIWFSWPRSRCNNQPKSNFSKKEKRAANS